MAKTITDIKAQKNKNRVNIYLDGDFAFGLSRHVAAWLRVGQELSEGKIADLLSQDKRETAFQKAVNLLNYRPRSEAEIRERLRKYDVDDETSDAILDRMRQSNLVDDRKFAENWVENRSEFSPRGHRALQYELRQKKIKQAIIDEVLASIDEHSLALDAARQKIHRLKNLEKRDYYKKLGGFLSRRGFSYDVISPVIEHYWNEETLTKQRQE